jgi:hypothetical protein
MIDYFTSLLSDQHIDTEFDRIKDSKEISSSNIPYTIDYVNMMIKHFESVEEYEKCIVLSNYKKNRILHDKYFINYN